MMVQLASLAWLRLAGVVRGGDFGPVEQNPDDAFRRACELAGSCSRRVPEEPPPPPPSSGGAGGIGGLFELLIWLLVIGLVVGLGFLVVRAVTAHQPSDDVDGDVGSDAAALAPVKERIIDRSREPDTWREEAARLVAAGRYREAMRCRYRGLVGDLARRGLLDEIPGRTTGEERRQLAELDTPAQPAFEEATYLFDDAWYGDLSVGESEYAMFVGLEESVLVDTGVSRRGNG